MRKREPWRFEFDSEKIRPAHPFQQQQPTTNNLIKNHHRYIIHHRFPPTEIITSNSKSAAMPLHYSLLYYMMPAEPFR
jgi:hypothetical protein